MRSGSVKAEDGSGGSATRWRGGLDLAGTSLGYGRVTDAHAEALAEVVADRVVHDLGAGDMQKADLLARLGAREVHAVEKERRYHPPPTSPRVTRHYVSFEDYRPAEVDVAFLSWPDKHVVDGLLQLLARAETIVYLGKNTDGSMCGFPAVFEHMVGRRLLAYVPHFRNTLVVVGARLTEPRAPQHEELAGLLAYEELLGYDGDLLPVAL